MPAIKKTTYVFECNHLDCDASGDFATMKDAIAANKAHSLVHTVTKGDRVRVVATQNELFFTRRVSGVETGDTGVVTYAYYDQDRYGVRFDKSAACPGAFGTLDHCPGCTGHSHSSAELKFADIAKEETEEASP